MLNEISRFRNYGGCSDRRLFTDSDMDLYIWFNEGVPERFHLTYNKQGYSHSVSWNNETGFSQQRFAQIKALTMMTSFSHMLDPFFIQDEGGTPASVLAYRFLHASNKITPWLADFIYARLLEYPGHNATHINQGTVLRSF
jgi:hypothetical protein